VPKLTHLSSSAGGGSGGLVRSLKTPPGMHGAQLVLYKLAQKVALDTDKGTTGFGNRHQPATINYYRLFKVIDADCNRSLDLDEFNKAIRKAVGISSKAVNDDEIVTIFEAMDKDKDGTVSLAEFASFAKASAKSSAYHGELSVFQLRGSTATTGGAENTGAVPDLCKDGSQLLYHSKEHDVTTFKMPMGLSDKAAAAGMKEPAGMDAVLLILWHLSQHVAYNTDSAHSTGNQVGALRTNPANVSYKKLFSTLDLDHHASVSREEWAISLRKHVGVGPQVSDADLVMVFDAIDTDGSGMVSLKEFANFARGASVSTLARGVAFESAQRPPSRPPSPKA